MHRELVFEAAEKFDIDPYLLGAILIDEIARLIPFESIVDKIELSILGRNTSFGVAQVKTDTANAIAAAKDKGYTIYSVEQTHNSSALQGIAASKNNPIALIFGNEVNGVSDEALSLSEECIEIPQWGSKHSLNISVSVGVVVWDLVAKMNR